jgi:hypothetical protein
VDEALDLLGDRQAVEEMVERAYEDVYVRGRHTYRHFARILEQAVAEQRERARRQPVAESDPAVIRNREAMELERRLVSERFKTGFAEARHREAAAEAARLRAEMSGLLRERRLARKLVIAVSAALAALALLAVAAALALGGRVGP